jgi:hypothetical protein
VLFCRILYLIALMFGAPNTATAWGNGPPGNATTNKPSECDSPPYSTHDWIADHAVALLPEVERAWLYPLKSFYLLGTEAPDNDKIPAGCNAPNTGYDDRNKGHSVSWLPDWSDFSPKENGKDDRAAWRAQEEYKKAVDAFKTGDKKGAAFYLGAMAHYIGDVSQYGHSYRDEKHHSDYETWAKTKTKSFSEGVFEKYINQDKLVRRTPYAAVKIVSKITGQGSGNVQSALWMDANFDNKDNVYIDSVGHSLNAGVNALADVLHTFYLNVVK